MDGSVSKLAWVKLYIGDILEAPDWAQMKDYQRGWYIQLLLRSTRSERRGYLPYDGSLWRLAGAHTKQYWDDHSAVVMACFKRRQENGREWIYNERFLRMLEETETKIRTGEEKRNRNRSGKQEGQETLPLFSSSPVSVDLLKKAVDELFEVYREAFCRDSRYTLTESRRSACELRLSECMDSNGGSLEAASETARTAILNLSRNDWHLTTGHFDWTDHIFKTREIFEKRVGMKIPPKKLQPGTRSGAFAKSKSTEDEVLPEWFGEITEKIEAEERTVASEVETESDTVISA